MVTTTRRHGVNAGMAIKTPVKAASTANLTLSGEQTIDGISCTAGDRVFAKNQTDASEIGIYEVATSTWSRAPDWDGNFDITGGTIIPVHQGTTNADTYWRVTNTGDITVGTTDITVAATTVLSSAILNDGTVKMIADFSPNTTNTYDLGTSSLKWQDLHLNGTATVNTSIHMDDAIDLWDKGADIASASSLTLGSDGNYFDVTGTTTITAIASKGIGTVAMLHFDGALTLTHNATDLILPGAANITTAAGDEAIFVEYASGDWRCIHYQRAADTHLSASVATWTPQLWDTSEDGSEGQTYTRQTGKYIKIGRMVFLDADIALSDKGTLTAGSQAYIGNLPFDSNNTASFTIGQAGNIAAGAAGYNLSGRMVTGSPSKISIQTWDSTGGSGALTISELTTSASMYISGWYAAST